MTGGFPGIRGDPNDFGQHAQAASVGQTSGDIISVVVGTIVAVGGGAADIVEVASGIGAVAIPATTAVATEGGVTAVAGFKNLFSDDGVVQANKFNLDELDNLPQKERMDKGGGKNRPRNNKTQNEQTRSLSKRYNLDKKQQKQLHRGIQGKDLDYKALEKYIKENILKPEFK